MHGKWNKLKYFALSQNETLWKIYVPKSKVKVSRDRPRWPKGFRVG